MPLLFNGYQMSEDGLAIDLSKPHSNLPAGLLPTKLNNTKRFLNSDEDSTEEDESADAPSEDDPMVVCRHLALFYCQRSLEDPLHAPQASDLSVLRRQAPDPMEATLDEPRNMSRAFHMVCGRDFGLFLRHVFQQMRDELGPAPVSPRVSPPDSPRDGNTTILLARRVFLLGTGYHNLALRLAIWAEVGTEGFAHEVAVYDPNATDHQVQAFVHGLHEFAAHPQDHHLFSYLTPRSITENETDPLRAIGPSYFEPQHNTAFQMVAYELLEPGVQAPPGELEIDWSTSPRNSVHLAADAVCPRTLRQAMIDCLDQARREDNPGLLLEQPPHDHSLLLRLMRMSEIDLLRQWRRVWESADTDMKVGLLCAFDRHTRPLLFSAPTDFQEGLDEWAAMLNTLAPPDVLRVLQTTDELGRSALQMAATSPAVLQALEPVLQRCAQTQAQAIAQCLAHADEDGCTALGTIEPELLAQSLDTWVRWLLRWADPTTLPALLDGRDENGTPALVNAIKVKAERWITHWLAALASLTPEAAYDLLNPKTPTGKPILQYLFKHQSTSVLKAWFDALSQRCLAEEWPQVLLQIGPRGYPAMSEHLIARTALEPAFNQVWTERLQAMPSAQQVSVLRAWDQKGRPALLHAIRAGNPQGVRDWGNWLTDLDEAQQTELLRGLDAQGASLLAQPWGDPHEHQGGFAVGDGLATLPAPIQSALQAWMDLLCACPLPTQMDMLSGTDALGRPWWMAMAFRGDSALIDTVVSELNRRIPASEREQMVERLGVPGQDLIGRLRLDLAERGTMRGQMASALQAMGDWLPAGLRTPLLAVLAQD